MNFVLEEKKNGIRVGKLKYGTVLQYNGSIYLKVNKGNLGDGINLNFTPGNSVLMNLKLGTLRQLKGDTIVTPLGCSNSVYLHPLDVSEYGDVTK